MKEYLVCIDSDGCAIDAMTIKHERAFGPVFVETFGLQKHKEEILKEWEKLNLYSLSRGINRFRGLYEIMKYVIKNFEDIDGFEHYEKWVNTTSNFSNDSIEKEIENDNHEIFKKVLKWSNDLNEVVKNIPEEDIKAFENAKKTIEDISKTADIAIVSSANKHAIESEWEREGLLKFVKYFCTQEVGTKEYSISKLLEEGYDKEKVIKIGDAMGDLNAALANDVYFYPILANHEEESWKEFDEIYFEKFLNGQYNQEELIHKFKSNLE